jgi:tRNA (cytidine/uridine-2'-O-)-methyltransferase
VGLSKEVLAQFENHLSIPIKPQVRSFNLANAVAFAIGEGQRQLLYSK